MKQMAFADSGFASKRKQPHKELFLIDNRALCTLLLDLAAVALAVPL